MRERVKIFFNEGDTVRLKIEGSPEMLVMRVDMVGRGEQARELDGISCMWFDSDLHIKEYKFNTKDLIKVKER